MADGVRRLLLTPGEPAGIGPDLVLKLATLPHPEGVEVVAVADRDLLASRAQTLGLDVSLRDVTLDTPRSAERIGELKLIPVELAVPSTPGQLDPTNAGYVLRTLDLATDACLQQRAEAIVTGPVQKSVINDAGVAFTGHTEYLAQRCGSSPPVMMLAAGSLRVALATTHLPLRAVADAITPESLIEVLTILDADLRSKFGIRSPRILVCGLNPHAGESGHLGREEIEVISPVLSRLRAKGMQLIGPLPADTLFTPRHLEHADAVLAMFHDQGLPVLKYAGFGHAVNITLGLPIMRTSVDHGTALELAGTGRAEVGSLLAAVQTAATMTENLRRPGV